MSTPKQRQIIGFLRRALNLADDTYYAILEINYSAGSSKDLTYAEAEELIGQLRINAVKSGALKASRFFGLDRDKKMASPKQLRMIEAMWKDVSFKETEEDRKTALNRFIYRITGKQRLRFLTAVDIRKIVNALNKMKEGKNVANC